LFYVDADLNGATGGWNYSCISLSSDTAGWKLKTAAPVFWNYTNITNYSTNSIGFSALGSGARDWQYGHSNGFSGFGEGSKFWMLDNYEARAYSLVITNGGLVIIDYAHKYKGYSVRCIKD
jgi:uncharacterized protein (TIGR02145 family)